MPTVLRNLDIEKKVKNHCIVEKWVEIVGERIAAHAYATGVDSDTLYVAVDTTMWQSQLFLMKQNIIDKCKEYNVNITDIKFSIAHETHKKETE